MNCIQSESPKLGLITDRYNKQSPKNNKSLYISSIDNYNENCYYSPSNCAVYIRNLCKSYGGSGPPVVENLSMNVRKGTIYGLLGASGCGKTTVLSCIVGLRKWDSGDVQVFGNRPGTKESGIPGKRLGYMPQDLALYNQLTIREIIEFYGRIYNMSGMEMRERWMFLNKLLDLPTDFKLIGDLSGGQKRRASLALALIHCPDLLVLDEPTVGLDPLLRRNIWNHLYKIVSTLGTTIIITTHYIEEARLSNTIGVLRRGRLLVEDTPTNLLTFYNSSLLEDVVLQLCRKDEKSFKVPAKNLNNQENDVQFKSPWKSDALNNSLVVSREEHEFMDGIFRKSVGFDCDINQYLGKSDNRNIGNGASTGFYTRIRNNSLYQAFQRIYGFTMVILMTFFRYPLFIAIILLLPTIQGYLTLATVGTKPSGMGLGIVNHELSNWTTECKTPQHLNDTSCDLSELSCNFLRQLDNGGLVDLIAYSSEEAALNATHMGKVWGYLKLDANFSQHSLDLASARRFAENETLEGSRVRAYLDYSQFVASFFMIKDFLRAYGDYVKQLAGACNIGGKEAELPLEFRTPVYGHYGDDYTEFLMPGILLISLLGIGTVLVAVIFITDRKQGTLSRACVAGLTSSDIIMGHMISQGFVTIAQIIIWNIILHFVFGLEIHGSIILYLVMCILVGFCGTAIGILLGILCRDEVEALIFGVFWSPVLLLFGGVFWPVESMSHFWQNVGMILPTTLPIKSLRSILVRGVGLTHQLVWPGVLVLVGWTVVFSVLVGFTYKRFYK